MGAASFCGWEETGPTVQAGLPPTPEVCVPWGVTSTHGFRIISSHFSMWRTYWVLHIPFLSSLPLASSDHPHLAITIVFPTHSSPLDSQAPFLHSGRNCFISFPIWVQKSIGRGTALEPHPFSEERIWLWDMMELERRAPLPPKRVRGGGCDSCVCA